MPLFLYSQIDQDVSVQKDRDRAAIITASQGVTLSAHNKQKLDAFLKSVEELHHVCNRKHGEPAAVLNARLHNLSIAAKKKIEESMIQNYASSEVIGELNFLETYLNRHKSHHDLKYEYIKAGIITAIALIGCFASVILLPSTLSLFLVLDVLLLAASSFIALFFGEKSIDTYKLAHDHQLRHIQSFFGPPLSLNALDTMYLGPTPNAVEIEI
ncbi:MAG: hypothetical protein GW760_06590 [Legionella sp.]|jgi:hypothetical protein|nr:hypothetical protein [Legionella sp.]